MYRAALCGLGNIACKFGSDESGDALCHANAIRHNASLSLDAGCDPDAESVEQFSRSGDVAGYVSLEEMLLAERPDLVSICSPGALHAEHVQLCLDHDVSMIWLEKPPAETEEQLADIIRAARGKATVLVNYQRRYSQGYRHLRDAVSQRRFGDIRRISISYSRGLEVNGSHLLDIMFFILGDRSDGELRWVSDPDDPNPSFVLRFPNGPEVVVQGDALSFHNIDISALFDDGRVSVLHGGLTCREEERVEHELYPGFYRLKESGDLFEGVGLRGSLERALGDLVEAHEQGRSPESPAESALLTLRLVNAVRRWGKR